MVRKTNYENKDHKKGKTHETTTVSVVLSLMNKKPDQGASSSSSSARKPISGPKLQPYEDMDLPPSNDDDEEEVDEPRKTTKKDHKNLVEIHNVVTKKLKKKETTIAAAARRALEQRRVFMKDDCDAFTVTIGTRVSVNDGQKDEANANVKDITVNDFSVSVTGKELLKNVSLKISHGKRYGLVGPNGMGKSTLLKLLAWREIPVPENIDILMVEQEIVGDDMTAVDAVVSANQKLISTRKEFASLMNEEGNIDTIEKVEKLYQELQIMGSDSAEARASKILAGLGFTSIMQRRTTQSFSGGWRMRISLARALFVQPTLLLLDEPTNHLDLRAVLWLEEYLCKWKNTLVVVSHDRDFLNTVCNEIIHLHYLKLCMYSGNYDAFLHANEQKRIQENKEYEKQVKAAKATGKQKVEKVKDYMVRFHFPNPTELRQPLLTLDNVSFSYPRRHDFKLCNVNVGVDMGTRVAIVGPNGAGKSTLLNLLAGKTNPTEGEVWKSQKLIIGRYSQHFDDLLTMDETPVEYLFRRYPDQEGCSKQEPIRGELSKFGLKKDNHNKIIANLSGGQKARVLFTSISMSRPHILLLDEPTNHLDMESIDALADALNKFKGGVVLVSHDSRLISAVCEVEEKSEIWEVDNGSVNPFDGTFEEYKEKLLREIRDEDDD